MSVENEQIIPVQVKYVELQSATILRNEKIPVPNKEQESKQNGPMLQNGLCQSPVAEENLHVTHGSSVTSPCTPINPIIHNRFQFDPNLTYAEKVAHEMIVTEKIYLDNLKQIIDVSIVFQALVFASLVLSGNVIALAFSIVIIGTVPTIS